jgi:hypothetical protein
MARDRLFGRRNAFPFGNLIQVRPSVRPRPCPFSLRYPPGGRGQFCCWATLTRGAGKLGGRRDVELVCVCVGRVVIQSSYLCGGPGLSNRIRLNSIYFLVRLSFTYFVRFFYFIYFFAGPALIQ